MKIFITAAEIYLKDILESIEGNSTYWRAIYIKNQTKSSDTIEQSRRNQIIANFFKDLFHNEDGNVYICEDGDIIVLFQGNATHMMNKIREQGTVLLPTLANQLPDGTATEVFQLLDLSRQHKDLKTLITKKISYLNDEQRVNAQQAMRKVFQFNPKAFERAKTDRDCRDRPVILIVEDDLFTRRLITNTLGPDYKVLQAGDGHTALSSYMLNAPDIVFLDINLPDMNGLDILEEIMKHDDQSYIVMLSGNSTKQGITRALQNGAKGFIGKPFTKEKLIQYITQRKKQKLENTISHHPN